MVEATTLNRLRKICLALPDTKETLTWGHPHFRVGDKIFCGYGDEKGRASIGFKVTMDHQDALIMQDRFEIAAYVGRYGWVSMDASAIADWGEVADLVLESYQLIAPKRSLAKLAGEVPEARSRGTAKKKSFTTTKKRATSTSNRSRSKRR